MHIMEEWLDFSPNAYLDLLVPLAFPTWRWRWGHELHFAAVCQSHRWGENNVPLLVSPLHGQLDLYSVYLCRSLSLFHSSAPVTPSCPLSSQMPWCSPSLSLKRGTWKVRIHCAFIGSSLHHNSSIFHSIFFTCLTFFPTEILTLKEVFQISSDGENPSHFTKYKSKRILQQL